MSVARAALRESLQVDLSRAVPWAGALRAVPVVGLFAFGLAIGSPRVALTLGVGANLVVVISLVGGTRVPVGLMFFDVAGLGLGTFVGSVTASDTALHLCVLVLWSFSAGLLVALGLGPATAGVQSVIAFVVFGRFADAPLAAFELGLLVAAGAGITSGVLLILRLPPTLRVQRSGLTVAFREIARYARSTTATSAVATAVALDRAAQVLGTAALFGRTDASMLRALVDEGRRMRLELAALSGLRLRLEQGQHADELKAVETAIARIADEIEHIARSIEQPSSAQAISRHEDAPFDAIQRVLLRADDRTRPLVVQCSAHLEALEGQIRAATKLLDETGRPPRSHATRFHRNQSFASIRSTVTSDIDLLRASLNLHSSAFRHAVRLGVAVPGAGLLAQALGLPRGYWVAFTVATVLRPDYSSLFRRGLGRVVGTIAGATLAALVVGGLHPDTLAKVILVAFVAWGAYSLWQASFSTAIAFVTALILIFLSTTQVDSLSTATDRLVDTVVGGAIALGVYVIWPTWSELDARQALATVVRAERDYLVATLEFLQGQPIQGEYLPSRARTTRLAWSAAESAIGRSMDEPKAHRVEREFGSGSLSAMLRMIQATHSLRVEAQRGLTVEPFATFDSLTTAFSDALESLATRLVNPLAPSTAFELRAQYRRVATNLAGQRAPGAIALQLDEIVDAINTFEAIVVEHKAAQSDLHQPS